MNDLKFAFRQLLKNPGFTALAVITLALAARWVASFCPGGLGSIHRGNWRT